MKNTGRITGDTIRYNLTNLRQVTFEVTDDCNLQCRYCGYGEMYSGYDRRTAKYMAFKDMKPLINLLRDIWESDMADSSIPITYFSFYGGEPLLNMPFIRDAIDYIEQIGLKRKILYSMTTNAILLDRYMDYLVEKKFHILISLDGDREGHSYRVDKAGASSFDRVIRNTRRLKEAYPDFFKTNVNFNAVLHNRNSVQSIHDFISREFGKMPAISELNNSGIRPDKVEEFRRTYRNKTESLHQSENYEKLAEEMFINEPDTHDLTIYLHEYSGNVFRDYINLFTDPDNMCRIPTGTCTPFSRKMFVTVNGKILQCERIDHCFSLGKVSENQIDLNPDTIASTFNVYLDKMQCLCSACYRKQSCTQCMYYIETIQESHPECLGFMDKKTFDAYSSYCLAHLHRHPELYRRLMTEVVLE